MKEVPLTKAQLTEIVVAAMRRAGTPEEFIYAFQKTGVLVAEDNRHLISPSDLENWDRAIDEYEQTHKK